MPVILPFFVWFVNAKSMAEKVLFGLNIVFLMYRQNAGSVI